MITGLTLFILATYTWVSDRLRGKALSTEGVYKLSRHPMYLGFIIWSFGLLYLASTAEPGRGWSPACAGTAVASLHANHHGGGVAQGGWAEE